MSDESIRRLDVIAKRERRPSRSNTVEWLILNEDDSRATAKKEALV